jgi:hypothetical protein
MSFWMPLRAASSQTISASIVSGSDYMALVHRDSQTGAQTDLAPRIAVPPSGQLLKFGAAVEAGRYRVFMGGRQVIEAQDDRLSGSHQPSFSAIACGGTAKGKVTLTGARVYELAGLASGPGPASGSEAPRTAALSASNPGHSGDVASYKGPLLYEMKTDGPNPNVSVRTGPSSRCDGGAYDPTLSTVELLPAGVRLTILAPRSIAGVSLAAPTRLSYVIEYEISFDPAGATSFWSSLRASQERSIALNLVSSRGYLQLVLNESSGTTDLVSPISVQGLASGRTIRLAAAVAEDKYTLFVDGQRVAEYTDSQLRGPALPGVSAVNCFDNLSTGSFELQGLRVYELSTR